MVAFPAMSTPRERRAVLLRALSMIAAIGVVCVVGSIVARDLAMVFVGGEKYSEISADLWKFAVLGTLLAALQLMVYSVLARQSRRSAWLIWAAVVVVASVGWWGVSTIDQVLTLVIITDAVLLVCLIGLSLWTMRGDAELDRRAVVESDVPA